jgi:NADP-dependent 3-hydroxy acid dehydrogenase YdfG
MNVQEERKMGELELMGRTAVITGAGSGIGRALALKAAVCGMSVAIADIDAAGLAETEEMLRQRQARVLTHVVDVRSADDVEAFALACFKGFSSIAMVWANAGIIIYDSAIRPNLVAWNRVIDVNLRGVLNCQSAFLDRMIERNEPAQFVITGSQASFIVAPEIGAYAACKHGLWAIAEILRMELAADSSPVQVSLLAPPRTATAIIATTIERTRLAQGEGGVAALLASLPTPEAIADLAMSGAVAREFLLLPFYDLQEMFLSRIPQLV